MNIELQLEKARIYAYCTFLGLMFPIAGIITYCISKSITDRLEVDTDEQLAEANRIESSARVGLTLSVIVLVLIIVWIWAVSVGTIYPAGNFGSMYLTGTF